MSDLAHILDAEHAERVLGFPIKPCWCCGKPAEVDMSCTCARCTDKLCWGYEILVPVVAWNKRAPAMEGMVSVPRDVFDALVSDDPSAAEARYLLDIDEKQWKDMIVKSQT